MLCSACGFFVSVGWFIFISKDYFSLSLQSFVSNPSRLKRLVNCWYVQSKSIGLGSCRISCPFLGTGKNLWDMNSKTVSDVKAEDSGLKDPGFDSKPRQEKQKNTHSCFWLVTLESILLIIVSIGIHMPINNHGLHVNRGWRTSKKLTNCSFLCKLW